MSKTPTGEFNRGLSNNFIKLLQDAASANCWWRDVLDDHELLIAVRNESLNIYFKGQRIFLAKPQGKEIIVSTHPKYLIDPNLYKQVKLVNKKFNTTPLQENGFIGQYNGTETLNNIKKISGGYSGIEKNGCHKIALNKKNDNIVDVEVAFTKTDEASLGGASTGDRIDFVCLEATGDKHARMEFWEAKHFGNNDLRANAEPKVLKQIRGYRKTVENHAEALSKSYTDVCKNLYAIATMRGKKAGQLIQQVASGERKISFQKPPTVNLLVFDFDKDQKVGSYWKKHKKTLVDELARHGARLEAKGKSADIKL